MPCRPRILQPLHRPRAFRIRTMSVFVLPVTSALTWHYGLFNRPRSPATWARPSKVFWPRDHGLMKRDKSRVLLERLLALGFAQAGTDDEDLRDMETIAAALQALDASGREALTTQAGNLADRDPILPAPPSCGTYRRRSDSDSTCQATAPPHGERERRPRRQEKAHRVATAMCRRRRHRYVGGARGSLAVRLASRPGPPRVDDSLHV